MPHAIPASIDLIWLICCEIQEYATEVDVDFVRKSVRAIGRCAIKVKNKYGLKEFFYSALKNGIK